MRGLLVRCMFGYFVPLVMLGSPVPINVNDSSNVTALEFDENGRSVSVPFSSEGVGFPADSLIGRWRIEVQVADVRDPSENCEYSGNLDIRAADSGALGGGAELERFCSMDGQMRQLGFDGPIEIELEDGERWIVMPDCRLRIGRVRTARGHQEAEGFARCVVQEMRAARVLEGSWTARQDSASAR